MFAYASNIEMIYEIRNQIVLIDCNNIDFFKFISSISFSKQSYE